MRLCVIHPVGQSQPLATSLVSPCHLGYSRSTTNANAVLILQSCLAKGKRMVHAGASSRRKRSRNQSGAKAKSFTEGWIEYEDKRVAKQVTGRLPLSMRRSSALCCELKQQQLNHVIGPGCLHGRSQNIDRGFESGPVLVAELGDVQMRTSVAS